MKKTKTKSKRRSKRLMVIIATILGVVFFVLAARAGHVYISVSRFASYWRLQAQQQPQTDSWQLVALGDSTVQGLGATSPMKGFVGQLAARLDKPVQIYNFSKSGATIDDVLYHQLALALKVQAPDLILIAVGPNDITQNKDQTEYLKKYRTVLAKLPANKIVIASIPPLERRSVPADKLQSWNDGLAELALDLQIRQAPIYTVISAHKNDQLIYAGDFFHPSNRGYKLWAEAFFGPAQEVLKP